MLEIKNYSLEYIKGKKAVDNISLEIQNGDIFGFVGSNGAGKTTTIKSIVGINHITSGDILIDNISIIKKPLNFMLKEELNNLTSSYSHGMRQKLILIAAFMHNPDVYILDEPFASLDPEAAFVLKEEMRKKAEEGKIIFFSTVAEKLCNKVAIIIKGKIVKQGLMSDVINDRSLEETFMELV